MSSEALEPPRWSRRRWSYSILAVFVVQLGLILQLGKRPVPVPDRPIFRTAIQLAATRPQAERIAKLADTEDPLLLALPSLRGFSGPAWLEYPPIDYEPGDETEPPYWLPLAEASLGTRFGAFVAANAVRPLAVADKPLPRLLRFEPTVSVDAMASRSRLRVEGDLAARVLLSPASLRSWESSEILSNNVVQAAVDRDGFIVFAAILTQSGDPEVDAHALELTKRARFQPIARGAASAPGLTWGRFVFRWHIIPPSLTNPPVLRLEQ